MTDVLPPEVAAPRHRGRLRPFPRGREAAVRGLDLALASVALLLTAPVLLVVYLAVRLTSPGPGFFRQVRVGAGRREFVMYKFRTMRRDADPAIHEAYVRGLLRGEVEPEDGLYKLAKVSWHVAYQVLMTLLYVALSVRLIQLILAFRGGE